MIYWDIFFSGLRLSVSWSSNQTYGCQILVTDLMNGCYHAAKKLPKSDQPSGGQTGGTQRQRGVDLQEPNQQHSGGCCK